MPPSLADHRGAFLAACPVSRETEAQLDRFALLLADRNRSLSLIADSTMEALWTRHFLDSAQILRLIPDPEAVVVDLGTGAGFPGLVLGILGLPKIHLIENNMQKVAFLRNVVAELGLPVTVHAMKIEAVRPFAAGTVTARALKPLDQLIGLSRKFMGSGSACVFPKGRRAEEELRDAERRWRMKTERFQSLTDAGSTIFRISDIQEAES